MLVHSHQAWETPHADDSHDSRDLISQGYDQEELDDAEEWAPEGEAS